MLVDFLKANHLRVAATLPWLWVCLAIGQGRSQGVPGSMAGPGSPTIIGSQVRGPKKVHLRPRRRPVQLRKGQNEWFQGGAASGRHQKIQRKKRQSGVSANSANSRWYRGKSWVGRASASSASDGCLRTGFSDPSRGWCRDGGGSASRHSIFSNKLGALGTLAAGFGSDRVTLSSVDAAAAGLKGLTECFKKQNACRMNDEMLCSAAAAGGGQRRR
jgi:hypothetical protein